jgi:steroid 5-alpha reductase family enzyme
MILIAWVAAIIAFSLLWLYQKKSGDAGIVDVGWGLSVGLLSSFFCWGATTGNLTRRGIVAVLAMAWAVRLSYHVFQRLQKHAEDGRYVELKQQWGNQVDRKMFQFYQFQALASVLFALPMLIAAFNPNPIGPLDVMAILLWIAAIGGESLADYQLDQFRNNPAYKGKVCQAGLWKYSRHPNYFFEWIHWWTYVLLAISYPFGWLNIIAPLSMLFFILKVTGIPPTERQAIKSRGEAYRNYQRTTNAFFPWFPKQTS